MLKKTLIILIILLVLVAGTLVVYNFFFKKEAAPVVTEELPEEKITPSPTAKIKPISQEPVLAPTIDNQKIKYYLANNGNVFESNFVGSDLERLTSNALQGLKYIIWAPNKTKVIGIFEKDGEVKKYFYDYQTKKSALLNQNIQWLTWSPDSRQIAYQYYNPQTQENYISLADPDGSNWQNAFKTRIKDIIVEWPKKELISLRTRPSGLAQSELYTLNPQTSAFQKVLSGIYGLSALWSPSGEKFIFSQTNSDGRNLKLKITNKNGEAPKELNVLTLPEKCVWSQDERYAFCSVPSALPPQAILPDDYYKETFSTADDFYKINTETNQKTLLIEPEQMESDYDATSLLLSPQEDYLFFVNKKDGLLYSLKL